MTIKTREEFHAWMKDNGLTRRQIEGFIELSYDMDLDYAIKEAEEAIEAARRKRLQMDKDFEDTWKLFGV